MPRRLKAAILLLSPVVLECCSGGGSALIPAGAQALATAPLYAEARAAAPDLTFTTETALSAGSFVRSVGVNLHTAYYGSAYTANVPALEKLIAGLGVGVVRDNMAVGNAAMCDEHRAIAASGPRFDYIVATGQTEGQIKSWMSCVGAANVSTLEGPNEYNLEHPASDPNWVATLTAEQKLVSETAKANYPDVKVIAPSITTAAAALQVGNLTPFLDFGNIHIYFDGYQPETTGYGPHGAGPNGYGSLGYFRASIAPISGSKPTIVTETGYGTAGGATQVSPTTQAKYMPRTLLHFAAAGISEIIPYELIDEGGPPYAAYGLVNKDLTVKPAYTAVQSLLALLHDSGSATGTLAVAATGETKNVAGALFRKSDGSFALAVWLNVLSCDPATGRDTTVPAQSVTLHFQRALQSPVSYTYDSAWKFVPKALASAETISLSVKDQVQVVTFK